jgi:hypothetical protein
VIRAASRHAVGVYMLKSTADNTIYRMGIDCRRSRGQIQVDCTWRATVRQRSAGTKMQKRVSSLPQEPEARNGVDLVDECLDARRPLYLCKPETPT